MVKVHLIGHGKWGKVIDKTAMNYRLDDMLSGLIQKTQIGLYCQHLMIYIMNKYLIGYQKRKMYFVKNL